MTINEEDFKLSKSEATASKITSVLRSCGVCVVENWIDAAKNQMLVDELERAVGPAQPNAENEFNPGRIATLKRAEIEQQLPETFQQFSHPVFKEVLDSYTSGRSMFNDDIFVTDHIEDKRQILPLHYDRLWCLKFYLYLKETTVNDGAFEVIPGSHIAGHKRRKYLLSRGFRAYELPNREDPIGLEGAMPLEGGSGTLIVFDSDVLHKGGIVGKDGRRLVMRGHSHEVPTDVYFPPKWSRQWIREAPYNPITALLRTADRLTNIDHSLKL